MGNTRDDAETLKLAAETRLLNKQASFGSWIIEWMKAIAGTAGVITAIAALVGLYVSISRFQAEEQQQRASDELAQLNRSIALLADENQAKQLAGVSTLESFVRSGNSALQKQVLSVLVNILSVEDNKIVRDAIVASLRSQGAADLDNEIVVETLQQLAARSASLITEGDLKRNRKGDRFGRLKQDSVEARAASVSEALVFFLRNGGVEFKDLSGIYCVACDLSGLALSGANFQDAVLYLANFSKSSLEDSNFDGADIQSALFTGAALQDAHFTFSEEPSQGTYRSSYVSRFLRDERFFEGPRFDCADLRDADFSGHPLFGFVHDSLENDNWAYARGGTFVGADLAGADFSLAQVFGKKPIDAAPPFATGAGGGSGSDGVISFEYEFSTWVGQRTDPSSYQYSLSQLRSFFSGSNWVDAKLPESLRSWLDQNPPSEFMEFEEAKLCNPRPARDGFAPKLALWHREELDVNEVRSALRNAETHLFLNFVTWRVRKNSTSTFPISDAEKNLLAAAELRSALIDRESGGLVWVFAYIDAKAFAHLLDFLSSIDLNKAAELLGPFEALQLPLKGDGESVTSESFEEYKEVAFSALSAVDPNWRDTERKLAAELDALDERIAQYMKEHEEELLAPFH